jgi:hypothetical protein
MTTSDSTIRPFRIEFPEADLTELRRRINTPRRGSVPSSLLDIPELPAVRQTAPW